MVVSPHPSAPGAHAVVLPLSPPRRDRGSSSGGTPTSSRPRRGTAERSHVLLASSDFVAAAAVVAVSFVLVSFDARAWQGRLRRILDLGPSLRGPRLLLAFFTGLLAATAEALRLPFFGRAAMLPPRLVYPLVVHGIAEQGMLASVLLLLRACLLFLTARALVLVTPAAVVAYPGQPRRGQLAHAADGAGHCVYLAYATTLLLALVALYMPLLYYCMLGHIHRYMSPTIGLVGFLAVVVATEATLVILVMLPVHNALVLDDQLPAVATAGEDACDLAR
ncbi:hypothetical protein SETIT_4G165300v2 [Setaria italica]|uniref:Uncharacterized protein n=1 Tax=Setaria italica TaxID=4555 RepID=A0A368QVD9_SETIT|nr:hypothetical protein SETIT_4G165300v2 [Setaria italica]